VSDDAGALSSTASPDDASAEAPSLRRRMAAFIYEGVLLFGVLMISGYLYSSLTQMRHALHGVAGLQLFLFLILGIYFVWFWSHGGQTVAMRAWHIRLVDRHGQPVGQARALGRYLLCWLWFLPALGSLRLLGLSGGLAYVAVMLTGVVAYAALAYLDPGRQFWHDVVGRTRLITWRPVRGQVAEP
jgi:uncharacterized RDD family membrane protein YckC